MNSYGFVIPSYQHSESLKGVLDDLSDFNLNCVVVNDGSDQWHSEQIKKIVEPLEWVELVEHESNQGKGAAVQTGLKKAEELSWDYAVQIDSDGQHDLSSVNKLIKLSQKNPQSIISGQPVYDKSVPLGRKLGRYITHFWVWLETLSFEIKDSMCGFRVYPVSKLNEIINKEFIGKGMDFDVEIFVKSFWNGVKIKFMPVRVIYPENGISNFHAIKDNIVISKMHTRLFFGMLYRFPKIIKNKLFPPAQDEHWSSIGEKGTILGIRLLIFIYQLLGRRVIKLLLTPISIYYFLTDKKVRVSSKDYIKTYEAYCKENSLVPKKISTYQQIYAFAESILDKFSVWQGEYGREDLAEPGKTQFLKFSAEASGSLFIGAHLGNMELARAFGRENPHIKFNALVYTDNAVKYNSSMQAISKDCSLNILSVRQFGPSLAMVLKERVDRGEWLFIAGDRTSISEERTNIDVKLLGRPAKLPIGPFVLAYVLGIPAYSFFCFRAGSGFKLISKELDPGVKRTSANKKEFINKLAQSYAADLEQVILEAPEQWFNFFNFWEQHER